MDYPTSAPTRSVAAPPPSTRKSFFSRVIVGPLRFCRRKPGQALCLLIIFGLLVLAGTSLGWLLWADYHLRQARQALALGHNTVAIEHLKDCRTVIPDHRDVLILSSRVARRGGAWDEAEQFLDRYWTLYGDDEALVFERLLLRATKGEIEPVQAQLYARIAQGGEEATLAGEALVVGLIYRFRLDEASQLMTAWLQREPGSTIALLVKGKLHEVYGQTSEAMLTYRQLLEADPHHDEARLRLTSLLLEFSQAEEAEKHLRYLRQTLPNHPDVLIQLVQALNLLDRGEEARKVLADCLDRHPDHAAALAEQGKFLRQDGQTEKAEEYLARAIELDPGLLDARYQYLLALKDNQKMEEAKKQEELYAQMKEDIKRLNDLAHGDLQANPNDPDVLYEIAMIAQRAGRSKEALRWLENALRADPDHIPTHRAMASYYYSVGQPILSARHRATAQRLEQSETP